MANEARSHTDPIWSLSALITETQNLAREQRLEYQQTHVRLAALQDAYKIIAGSNWVDPEEKAKVDYRWQASDDG